MGELKKNQMILVNADWFLFFVLFQSVTLRSQVFNNG